MTDKKEFPTLVAGVCFAIVFVILYTAIAVDIGRSLGLKEAKEIVTRAVIRQGELPYNVPVMVYAIRDDGTISGDSALRTDYAGVLPFSTTHEPVPMTIIDGFDYWQPLDAIIGKEKME